MCPPVLQPENGAKPPAGYKCNCDDPNEVPDCKCQEQLGLGSDDDDCCKVKQAEMRKLMACECKKKMAHVATSAKTHVFDPNAPRPRRTGHKQKKFKPRSSEPNPLPPIREIECRPNVASIGPGNCRKGNSMGACATQESGCKGADNANKGFVAAALTDQLDPSDKEEDCEHKVSEADATATSEESEDGHVAKVVVSSYNKCTQKSKNIPAHMVHVVPPEIQFSNGQPGGSSGSDSLSESDMLGSSSESLSSLLGSLSSSGSLSQSALASLVSGSMASLSQSGSSMPSSSSLSSALSQPAAQSAIQQALGSSQKGSLSLSSLSALQSAISSALTGSVAPQGSLSGSSSASPPVSINVQAGSQSAQLTPQTLASIIVQAVQSALKSPTASQSASTSQSSLSGSASPPPRTVSSVSMSQSRFKEKLKRI